MISSDSNFIPRPGVINKQGCLPDPIELVCVEVPKVFDQCLIKRCLKYHDGPDTNCTDEELRSNPLNCPKIFLGCRDFNIKLLAFDKLPIKDHPEYSKIIIHFVISFTADYLDSDGNHCSEFFEINRCETISRLYFPSSIARIASTDIPDSSDLESEILKLELVAECLDGTFTKDCDCNEFLDVTIGFHLIVKCELLVQLLIPAYGYCPVPKPCRPITPKDPCIEFNRTPAPKFYPDQKLRPLFSNENDDEDDSVCDCPCDED